MGIRIRQLLFPTPLHVSLRKGKDTDSDKGRDKGKDERKVGARERCAETGHKSQEDSSSYSESESPAPQASARKRCTDEGEDESKAGAFAPHEIEHYVNPLLDIVRAPYTDWNKGSVAARQHHEERALQDSNIGLFDWGCT